MHNTCVAIRSGNCADKFIRSECCVLRVRVHWHASARLEIQSGRTYVHMEIPCLCRKTDHRLVNSNQTESPNSDPIIASPRRAPVPSSCSIAEVLIPPLWPGAQTMKTTRSSAGENRPSASPTPPCSTTEHLRACDSVTNCGDNLSDSGGSMPMLCHLLPLLCHLLPLALKEALDYASRQIFWPCFLPDGLELAYCGRSPGVQDQDMEKMNKNINYH
jgi:hypothetical protein